jgi:hypothetical protein
VQIDDVKEPAHSVARGKRLNDFPGKLNRVPSTATRGGAS